MIRAISVGLITAALVCASGINTPTPWSNILNPSGNLSLTMQGFTSLWTFNATTGSSDLFKLTDTLNNTGTGALIHTTTASGSSALPWKADANGVGAQINASGNLVSVGASLLDWSGGSELLPKNASDPAACTIGQIEFNTTSATVKACTTTNTWTTVGNSGTVTSISWTGGIVSIATPTTTPAFTIAGTSGGVVGFTSSSTWASSIAGVTGAMMTWGGAGNTPTSPLSLLVTNQNSASETWTFKNTTASTGVTNVVVAGGVANSTGGNPYMFKVVDNAGAFRFGVSPLNTFATNVNLCDENVSFPCNRFLSNSNAAIDMVTAVPGTGTPDSSSHGQFNIELGQNITSASGTGSFIWMGDNSRLLGFAPTSGTGVWNGLWTNWVINQTGGANGITRGVYVNNTITAAADFRGLEVSDVGSGQTAIRTGTGKVSVGGPIVSIATAPTITGCGTISGQSPGALAGTFSTNAVSCTPVLTGLPAAVTGYECFIVDRTSATGTVIGSTASTATSATFPTFTTVASDVLAFNCGVSF